MSAPLEEGYRLLELGEVIEEGDEVFYARGQEWYKSAAIGQRLRLADEGEYRRKIAVTPAQENARTIVPDSRVPYLTNQLTEACRQLALASTELKDLQSRFAELSHKHLQDAETVRELWQRLQALDTIRPYDCFLSRVAGEAIGDVARLKRILIRQRCGCFQRDCRKHGSWDPADVDLYHSVTNEQSPK